MLLFYLPSVLASCVLHAALAHAEATSNDYDAYNDGKLGHRPHLEFHSSTEFAPELLVHTHKEDKISTTSGSHIFLKHDGNEENPQSSPLILSATDLSNVFVNRSFENVFGTRVQRDREMDYLTFWEGQKGDGIGNGYGLVYDNTYQLKYTVSAQDLSSGTHSDLHEFALTGEGTALVTGVDRISANTSKWQGWRGQKMIWMLDAVFQEIDLDTNKVLFSWRALDHINPVDSFEGVGKDWDVYHMNSIQKTQDGNYLISVRHTHSIHLVSGIDGHIIWTLGGKRNIFTEIAHAADAIGSRDKFVPVLSMGWQHHARFLHGTNETQLTFFDNHVKTTSQGKCTTECSRGLHVKLDMTANPPTVQLLKVFHHPARLQAQSQGSVQPLATDEDRARGEFLGNVLIGWGRCPTFTEHTPDGETVLEVQFSPWHSTQVPDALDNYRAYKMDWVAEPYWDPAIAVEEGGKDDTLDVYVSWNGATEVKGWVVRGAKKKSAIEDMENRKGKVLAQSERTGFETHLRSDNLGRRYVWAEALDKDKKVIRATEIVDLGPDGLNFSGIFLDGEDEDDYYEDNDVQEQNADKESSESSDLSTSLASIPSAVWIVLGLGLGTLSLGAAVITGVLFWRRRHSYSRLVEEDKEMRNDTEMSEEDCKLLHSVDWPVEDQERSPDNEYDQFLGDDRERLSL